MIRQNNRVGQSNSEPIVTAAGTFPIVEEEVTLDVMIPSNSLVKDFDKNEFTKWYEEKNWCTYQLGDCSC